MQTNGNQNDDPDNIFQFFTLLSYCSVKASQHLLPCVAFAVAVMVRGYHRRSPIFQKPFHEPGRMIVSILLYSILSSTTINYCTASKAR